MRDVREWRSGMSFVRDWNDGESYAVVGLAIGGDQQVTVGGIRHGIYRDAVTGGEITVGDGALSFAVRGNSAGIWVLKAPAKSARTACICGHQTAVLSPVSTLDDPRILV